MRLIPQSSVMSVTVILSSGRFASRFFSDASSARFVICDILPPKQNEMYIFIIPFCRRGCKQKAGNSALQSSLLFIYFTVWLLSFWMTSCAPPSTMLVAETSVIFAFSCSSLIVSAPQLHIVDLTLLSDRATLSLRLPA